MKNRSKIEERMSKEELLSTWDCEAGRGRYSHVKTYGDVLQKWVGLLQEIPKYGSHFGKIPNYGSDFQNFPEFAVRTPEIFENSLVCFCGKIARNRSLFFSEN